ncbi:hypothetical protein SAMN05421881_10753 [Nitrosomonas halophila]|uniref:Uncharacterized protein n=1 Tax=Nitrosomonas halophila TaxID=44576 RepID=A0A1H3NJK7_9PROT|nr:hypothetical protein SAMN05421881_10753 [Nitrosomonas halophila]
MIRVQFVSFASSTLPAYFEEQQVGDLSDVVAAGTALVTQEIGIAPDFGND